MTLTAERARELFAYDPDTGVIAKRADGRAITGLDHYGYSVIVADGKHYKGHRLAWLIAHGEMPDGVIDHINGQPADNRLSNLRVVDKRGNAQNMKKARKDNVTGYLGVSPKRGRFRATIFAGGKQRLIGTFADPLSAHMAYVEAKRQLHPAGTL